MGPRTAVVYRTSKHVRIALAGLVFAVIVLAIGLGLILALVLSLKAQRDHAAAERQAAINQSLCSVIDQFPPGLNSTLDQVRAQLHCPPVQESP